MTIKNYSTTPDDNDDFSPNGFPEGMPPSGLNNSNRQGMTDQRLQWNDAEWFEYLDGDKTGAASYVSTNVFKITGSNATAHYHVGRRVKIIGGSVIYANITAVSYGGGATNVTVDEDLTNEAITVCTAIMSATNPSLPIKAVKDIVGEMLTDNTETNITVTYQDGDGTIDFEADVQTENDFTTVLKDKLDLVEEEANKYVHPASEGYEHIPSGGNSGEYLSWTAAGTAVWASAPWAASDHNHDSAYKANFTTTVSTSAPSGTPADGDLWYEVD